MKENNHTKHTTLLERTVNHYWILIILILGLLVIDVGATAILVITENPTTKEVKNGANTLLGDAPTLVPEYLVGTHTTWDKEPSWLLQTTESLMIPLAMLFLLTCMAGMLLKIAHEKKSQA